MATTPEPTAVKKGPNCKYSRAAASLPETTPGQALVVVACPRVADNPRSESNGLIMKVRIDGKEVAANQEGTFAFAYVEPGERAVVSQRKGNWYAINLKVEAGQAYYFSQDAVDGRLARRLREFAQFEAQGSKVLVKECPACTCAGPACGCAPPVSTAIAPKTPLEAAALSSPAPVARAASPMPQPAPAPASAAPSVLLPAPAMAPAKTESSEVKASKPPQPPFQWKLSGVELSGGAGAMTASSATQALHPSFTGAIGLNTNTPLQVFADFSVFSGTEDQISQHITNVGGHVQIRFGFPHTRTRVYMAGLLGEGVGHFVAYGIPVNYTRLYGGAAVGLLYYFGPHWGLRPDVRAQFYAGDADKAFQNFGMFTLNLFYESGKQ